MVDSAASPNPEAEGVAGLHLPDFDPGKLREQTFGDEDLARELLGLFEAQSKALGPIILSDGTPAGERRNAAHRLKGAALAVGALRLAEAAGRIDREEGAPAGLAEFRAAFEGALATIRAASAR